MTETKHSYARQVLEERGITIWKGEEQILKPLPDKVYDVPAQIECYYQVGKDIVEKEESVERITSYEHLKELGWAVKSRPLTEQEKLLWKTKLHVKYELVPVDAPERGILSGWPTTGYLGQTENYYVIHSPKEKKIQLIGRNAGPKGYGDIIDIDVNKKEEFRTRKKFSIWELDRAHFKTSFKAYQERLVGKIDEQEFKEIKELVAMITESGDILCINPADGIRMGIYGSPGSGKTLLLHATIDQLYHRFGFRIALLNDSQAETEKWTLPNDYSKASKLLAELNLPALPLPLVPLHPSLKDKYNKILMDEVGQEISLPMAHLLKNTDKYFFLEGSQMYLEDIAPKLVTCRTKDEMMATIEKLLEKSKGTIAKIQTTFNNIIKERITDFNTGIPAEWRVQIGKEIKIYNPLVACIYANVVAVIITQRLVTEKRFPEYFQYYVSDLFDRMGEDPDFKKLKVCIGIDEAHHTKPRKDQSDAVVKTFERCAREGRFRNLNVIASTQIAKDIPKEVKLGLIQVFLFNNPSEANDLCNLYKLGETWKLKIAKLKEHECIAYAHGKAKFVLYKRNGTVDYNYKGPVKGTCMLPMSNHSKSVSD